VPRTHVLLVRTKATATEVLAHLRGHEVTFAEAKHVSGACVAAERTRPDLVIVDDLLPPWDLHVLNDRFKSVLRVNATLHPAELALFVVQRLPHQERPTFETDDG